jgi:hypothetical protein
MSASTELATDVQSSAQDIGCAVVILCDLSSSMQGKRIQRLREALESIWATMPRARILGFASTVFSIAEPRTIPEPSGSTALHLALDAASILRPAKVIVMSDGQPDDEDAALAMAQKIPGIIDIFFCGDDQDRKGITFMHKLARVGGGRVVVKDIAKTRELLGPVLRDMLSLPAPISL